MEEENARLCRLGRTTSTVSLCILGRLRLGVKVQLRFLRKQTLRVFLCILPCVGFQLSHFFSNVLFTDWKRGMNFLFLTLPVRHNYLGVIYGRGKGRARHNLLML